METGRNNILSKRVLTILCCATILTLLASWCPFALATEADATQATAVTDVVAVEGEEQNAIVPDADADQGEKDVPSVGDSDTDSSSVEKPSTEQRQTAEAPADQAEEGQAEDSSSSESQEKVSAEPSKPTETNESATKPTKSSDASKTPTKVVQVPRIASTVVFSGPDGEWWRTSDLSIDAGSSAWVATLSALQQSGMPYETGSASTADVIVSLAPDRDSQPCELDVSLGSAWHLYINGEWYEGAANTYEVKDGDELEWRFEIGTITVSVSVVGPGGTGLDYWISPTDVEVEATGSAWDASRTVFEQNGYIDGRLLSYSVADDGSVELESLASLGENGLTGERWQVFVNGSLPDENIALLPLRAGDSICWYYAGNGEGELPSFAAKTGAASQNPATTVWVDGIVSQAWTRAVDVAKRPTERLHAISDVYVLGHEGTWSLTASPSSLADSLDLTSVTSAYTSTKPQGWHSSLAHLMDGKILHGQGGQATINADGSLYYLDNLGSVVKLEIE